MSPMSGLANVPNSASSQDLCPDLIPRLRTHCDESNGEPQPHYLCLHVNGGSAVKIFPLLESELRNTITFLENATVSSYNPFKTWANLSTVSIDVSLRVYKDRPSVILLAKCSRVSTSYFGEIFKLPHQH